MIYLVEDKTSRRNDYGWSDKRCEMYKDYIRVIDSATSLLDNASDILSADNIILYHESFANSVDYVQKQEINVFLSEVANKNLEIAYFSGSKSQRSIDNNVCNLPPHVLYANLEHFINMHVAGKTDFKYLLFGKYPELEDKLRNSIINVNAANVTVQKKETDKKLFFFLASDEPLDPPYENIITDDSFDFDCDDASLSNSVMQDLNDVKYDGIYVPLCFGETLSDFLGLRLAMLIRFSKTINKHTPIVIYGEADFLDIITNECFDILKAPGIFYVHSDNKSIYDILPSIYDVSESEYIAGLKNIHLNIPSDIGDNHSVSNKWAIYRWAHALNISTETDFSAVEDKVTNSLYFKYLNAINSFRKIVNVTPKDLIIDSSKSGVSPKVLFIDDQADEGWYEALCSILYDKNNIGLDYLGEELKLKSCDEIIEIVKEKVSTYSPDIVILDLRLCTSDFSNRPIKDLTGNKVLRCIKQINRGIQVLIFSSTSKVWNYQYLSSAEENIDGADGFIVKERPEDGTDPFYTRMVIKYFINNINNCCNHIYRKELWEKLQEDIIKCNSSFSEYGKAVAKLLELAEESLFARQTNLPYASIFMNLFRVVEATANQYINDWPVKDADGLYVFKFKNGKNLLKFSSNGTFDPKEPFKHELKSLPYFQKICNTLYLLGSYSDNALDVVNKRNAFTHPNMSKQEGLEEIGVKDVLNAFDIVHKLIQNQAKI